MPANNYEYFLLLPHIVLSVGIVLSILIEIFTKKGKEILPWVSSIIFLFVGVYSLLTLDKNFLIFGGTVEVGGKAAIFNFIFNIAALLTVLTSIDYIKKYEIFYSEYYILIQSSVLGMMVMSMAHDIIVIFMGLELMSICFYVLAGLNRKRLSNNEAALKYFLLGSFATGFIVYGIALIYGITGATSIQNIFENFIQYSNNILFIVGMLLLLIGFSFKIAAVPFHMWVPDVYQGAATSVTGLMSTAGKAAAFSVLIIVLGSNLTYSSPIAFRNYFSIIALLSTLIGSIIAISQNNLKRMLAYSSIAHAGYMAIGLAAGNKYSFAGIVFYLAAYVFMNIGAFTIISIIEGKDETRLTLDSYAGLYKKNPFLAAMMSLFMFALAGIPPMAGFFGKYYVFFGAIQADLTWLAIIGVLSSVISVYFYLRVIVYIYFMNETEKFDIEKSLGGNLAISLTGLLVLFFGIFPDTFMNLITNFIK
ncbi:MAG: NADH-quinone oxidoreductase subunit N [Melioribacteraceae bacterium]|nr:NADH-quinone oxidoreductase subunit N [Melioribacteraceae bacterium]